MKRPLALVLSGGPASVYEEGAPGLRKELLELRPPDAEGVRKIHVDWPGLEATRPAVPPPTTVTSNPTGGAYGADAGLLVLSRTTALVHGLTVVTRDTAPFERIGVPYLDPWTYGEP